MVNVKSMKTSLGFFLFVLLPLGCGSDNPMVGTWTGDVPPEIQKVAAAQGKTITIEAVFQSDNSFTISFGDGTETMAIKGTYTLDGSILFLTSKEFGGGDPSRESEKTQLSDDGSSFLCLTPVEI